MTLVKHILFGIGLCVWSSCATAHVKWFANYNLVCPPRSLPQITFDAYFLLFCLVVGPLMFAVAFIDRKLVHNRNWLFRKADALTEYSQTHFLTILQIGVCAFFIAAASYGFASNQGFILTPELKTNNQWVFLFHLIIALLALLQRTVFLSGIGIAILYVHAVSEFGAYHLLDYPIFIGVAAYLIIESLFARPYSLAGMPILRLCTAITLLWAAIEKFAYPQWSLALLSQQPSLTLGFNNEFFMVAAGFVEFCAAYLLITGMLSARVAALVLLFFFVSAIYFYGVIDAIGHAVIIVVLVLLFLSHNPLAVQFDSRHIKTTAFIHAGLFFASLFLFIAIYYGGHYLSYKPFPACTSLQQARISHQGLEFWVNVSKQTGRSPAEA